MATVKSYQELNAGRRSNASKIRLILTAERLFGRRGIDSVSLREIALAAGSANNNAVQYHFGTKRTLLYAIYAYRIGQMEERRAAMLALAEAASSMDDVETLLRILCLPHLDLVGEDGSHPYAAFLVEFVTRYWRPGEDVDGMDTALVAPTLHRLTLMLGELSGARSARTARSRTLLCNLMFLNALLRWDNVDRAAGGASLALVLEDALSAMGAALRAPEPILPPASIFAGLFPMIEDALGAGN